MLPARPLPQAGCPSLASLLPKKKKAEGERIGVGTYLHPGWLGWELHHGAQHRALWGWVKVTVPCLCALQERAETITTFALCGFANISSIGIMLGGLSECDPRPGCLGVGQWDLWAGGICCLQASAFSL